MDGHRKHDLKPVIKEIVRTQVLFPDIELLIDKMTIVQFTDSNEEDNRGAYLVHLSDGEKSIPGMLEYCNIAAFPTDRGYSSIQATYAQVCR